MKKKSLNVKKITLRSILKYLNDKKVLKIFKKFESNLGLNKKFAIAVSGGPDSMALAFLAKCFSINNKLEMKCFIVDHKLRDNSNNEAKKTLSILKKFNIDGKILNWNGKKPSKNIQAIARKKRYALLTNECKKNNINYILLGHHVDDLYENFLLRLLRGSGLKGLTSFGAISKFDFKGIKILRPLINIKKSELIYLSNKIFNFYVEDPSNLNENFKRIRIRNLLKKLEDEGLDKKKLLLTISNLKNADSSIEFYIQKNIKKNSKYFEKKNTFLLNKIFFDQPEEITFRSLIILMNKVSNRYYAPRGKNIKNLVMNIKLNKISNKVTLGGCFIEKVNETIIISREKSIKS
jgi:tRNA(Ile)-lysidine synthase|tara:strand:- start:501 stop:1550 length:1050 start_codon:yes stop_codon:yes gene_type:complete